MDQLERKRLAADTIVRIVTTLRIALNAAVADRVTPDNVAARIKLPRSERAPVRALTAAEADAILTAVSGHRCEHLIRLLLGSGMRLGEAIGLDQGDLLLDRGFLCVRITKTQVRAIPISEDAVDALRAALAVAPRRGPDEPLFFGVSRHDRLRGDSVTQVLPVLMRRAGLGRLTPPRPAAWRGDADAQCRDPDARHRGPARPSQPEPHAAPL